MHGKHRSWRERLTPGEHLPGRIRYTRKSTEESDRQATSHEQQNHECDRKWGSLDPRWEWRDSFTGTTFDRPDFQDMIDFCKSNPRPRSRVGYIEMYAPSRFGRILDEENRPDLNAYMLLYLELERSGWQLRFVTIELTGNPMVDYVLIAIHATEAANYATNLSKDISRGLRNASRDGWWAHSMPPFGALRFDTRANRVLGPGETSMGGAGGVVLVADPVRIEAWEYAAHRLLAGDSLDAIGAALYARGVRGRYGGSLGHRHVRSILSNRALVGENDFADRDTEGKPVRSRVTARWPALVDVQLFRQVQAELERRAMPREMRRKARGGYPLRPICGHCGMEYNGSRLSKPQGGRRIYTHPVPVERSSPEAHARYQAAGCRSFAIVADELETAIRDLIVAERASADFEEEIRAYFLQREGYRTAAERSAEAARAEVRAAKTKLERMLRAITLVSDDDLDEAEFQREVEPLKQDLKAARRRLAEAEEMASSREEAWESLSSILHETRNLASAWDALDPRSERSSSTIGSWTCGWWSSRSRG